MSRLSTHHQWFSIITALGVTGFLLILAIWLTQVFLRESQMNRSIYDGLLLSNASEGTFEYARLKMKNHRDGFSDAIASTDLDSTLLAGSTPRSSGLEIGYQMQTQSRDVSFSGAPGGYIIVPLFTGDDTPLVSWGQSKRPNTSTASTPITSGLSVSGLTPSTQWTVLGMSGGTTVGRSGTGDITATTIGTTRLRGEDCYGEVASEIQKVDCQTSVVPILETIEYLYDQTGSVDQFLSSGITDPFLVIYNGDTSSITARVQSSTHPFTLPMSRLTTIARLGQDSQTIEFSEDKSALYDALKYSLYDTTP